MNCNQYNYPLIKLPAKIDHCLFLIREELKSRRFFDGLHRVGLDDIHLQPHLDRLILKSIGLDDGTDATDQFYFELVERRSKKIGTDNDSVVLQALKVYMELVTEKKRRKIAAKEKE